MKILAGIIGGLIVAMLGALVIGLGGAGSPRSDGNSEVIAFFGLWLVGIVVAVKAPSAAKAWRRLLITAAVLSFMLPLSAIFLTGTKVVGALEQGGRHAGAAATGAAIGGGLVSGLVGILGFFLGAVFLVIGLLVARDKQVVYVQVPPPIKGDTGQEPHA